MLSAGRFMHFSSWLLLPTFGLLNKGSSLQLAEKCISWLQFKQDECPHMSQAACYKRNSQVAAYASFEGSGFISCEDSNMSSGPAYRLRCLAPLLAF